MGFCGDFETVSGEFRPVCRSMRGAFVGFCGEFEAVCGESDSGDVLHSCSSSKIFFVILRQK